MLVSLPKFSDATCKLVSLHQDWAKSVNYNWTGLKDYDIYLNLNCRLLQGFWRARPHEVAERLLAPPRIQEHTAEIVVRNDLKQHYILIVRKRSLILQQIFSVIVNIIDHERTCSHVRTWTQAIDGPWYFEGIFWTNKGAWDYLKEKGLHLDLEKGKTLNLEHFDLSITYDLRGQAKQTFASEIHIGEEQFSMDYYGIEKE